MSPNSSSTNYSIKNISKETQNYTNNIKNETNNIKNNIIVPFDNNISKTINDKDLKKNQFINKEKNSTLEISKPNLDYELTVSKNRLLYENITNKLKFNNNINNELYNVMDSNSNENINYINEQVNQINKNNIHIISKTRNEKKKKDKDLNQAKTNNYYSKYVLSNNRIKNLTNKIQNVYDISKFKKGIDNNKNYNIKKTHSIENSYQNIYKSKKENTKTNISNQLNNSFISNKNHHIHSMTDRIKDNSLSKNGLTRLNINSIDKVIIPTYQEIKQKKLNYIMKNQSLTSKEESCYLLSISPVLQLTEQIIFSRASDKNKKLISIDNIMDNNYIFLNMKAKKLINEISLYDQNINKPFNASKTADITLNFITSLDEQEFKEFDTYEKNKELINIYYYYIKLFCILLDINYNNDSDNQEMKNDLFENINEKGFKSIKDYLYHIYIAKKEVNRILSKIDLINNEIFSKIPDILKKSVKICRFTAFTNYLLTEIINYGNNLKDIYELKFKAQYLLETVLGKIEKIQNNKKRLKKNNKN